MLEQQLNELSIFALRELARRTGVASPTSKKKDELINEILAIKSGKKQPQQTKTRQGRPPKGVNYNLNFISDNTEYSSTQIVSGIKLSQQPKRFEVVDSPTISGYVELLENNIALLWVRSGDCQIAYFIPETFVSKFNLKIGDFLVVDSDSTPDQKLVKDILSINGCPITKFDTKRIDYFNIEHVIPTKSIDFKENNFSNLNIKQGESVYLYGNNNNDNTIATINLLNSAQVDEKLYINISIAEKNKIYLNSLTHAEKFIANITDEVDHVKRVVCLAIERAKRIIETGKNALIVIDDVVSISDIDNQEKSMIKHLLSLTKCAKKGSLTIVAIMPNSQQFGVLEKLADKRFKIVKESIQEIVN